MRFKANFSPTMKIIFWTMAVVSCIGIVVGALIMLHVNVLNITKEQAGILLGFCPFAAIFATAFATIHYKVTNTNLQLKIAFIDLFSGKVSLERILNIVQTDGKLYISYITDGYDPIITHIAIPQKDFATFKAVLTDKNKNIVFYNQDEDTSED